MTRIKPFGKTHVVFDTPDEAITFYEENAQRDNRTIPASIRDLMHDIAYYDPAIKWAVQPGFASNFITTARTTDRRPWLFVKPEGAAIWVANDRNVEALIEYWDDLSEEPNVVTGEPTPFVWVSPDAVGPGAMCAVMFAAAYAVREDARVPA